MRRNFWQGWEEAGAFGWLVGWLFFLAGEGIGQEIQFRYLPNTLWPQLSPGLKDRR